MVKNVNVARQIREWANLSPQDIRDQKGWIRWFERGGRILRDHGEDIAECIDRVWWEYQVGRIREESPLARTLRRLGLIPGDDDGE